jgi:hypothetical protein
MGFQIGHQNARTINNVEGTQYNAYGDGNPRALLDQLRAELARLPLPPHVHAKATAELDAVAAEVARPEPDKPAIADQLGRLTHVLTSAGALVSAGTGLGGPLVALAGWLGKLGEPLSRLLHA